MDLSFKLKEDCGKNASQAEVERAKGQLKPESSLLYQAEIGGSGGSGSWWIDRKSNIVQDYQDIEWEIHTARCWSKIKIFNYRV